MKSITDSFLLSNGSQIPCIGYGTWQTPDGRTCVDAVLKALTTGYRHIDTASVYENEKGVGEAIKKSGLNRNELFITSKVWNSDRGYEKTLKAFEISLKKMQLDYLDLYLIHWPAAKGADWQKTNLDTWRALEHLYKTKRVKAIGVSNFLTHHLEPLMKEAEIQPMVDQIEFHPGYRQIDTVKFCNANHILVEAWSPLGTGKMLNNSELFKIARKYGKSAAQLCIRWCLQNNTLPLPKSVTPYRIIENSKVFDFEISDEDMALINGMPYFAGSGLHPDEVNF